MFRSSHCLHTLLPDLKVIDIVFRNSGTSFNLPHCSYKLYKQSFVNRCLFCDCYWHVLLCGTYMLFDLIWVIIFLHIIGLRLSVSINDIKLCYIYFSWCWHESKTTATVLQHLIVFILDRSVLLFSKKIYLSDNPVLYTILVLHPFAAVGSTVWVNKKLSWCWQRARRV